MKTVKDAVKEFNGVWPKCLNDCAGLGFLENPFGFGSVAIKLGGRIICTREEFEDYAKMQRLNSINKEAVKPVYTQEMSDNGELPKVGMITSCRLIHLDKAPETTGEVKYISNEVVVIRDENSNEDTCFYIKFSDFLPINTRTDEEKLIDDLIQGAALTSSMDKELIGKILEGYKIESGD